MPHLYCLVILTAGIYTVYTYPFLGPVPAYYPQEEYPESLVLQEPVLEQGRLLLAYVIQIFVYISVFVLLFINVCECSFYFKDS